MGSNDSDDAERPRHEFNLPEFWLAKYPVAVAQFRVFVESNKYKDFDKDVLLDPDTRPVRYVTWHNALDYCAWLDTVMYNWAKKHIQKGKISSFWQGLADRRLRITLPSEAEWGKAAGGIEGNKYPWKGEFDINKASIRETGIGTTCAVGAFPSGQSIYGLLDMSGNVWEWTLSEWDRNYPYKSKDGCEDIGRRDARRILRGGSFNSDLNYARCASRSRYIPYRRYDYFIGFRVAASPFSPEESIFQTSNQSPQQHLAIFIRSHTDG